ncbi:MAG TPA: pinensin family lanthipeptide [Longimicrobium sp.]|nr:pinensin family lanthipeptide [Longimicrobium sp.]
MQKLRLGIDQLRVESFATAAEESGEMGTVRGNQLLTRFNQGCPTHPAQGSTCDPRDFTCPECAPPPDTNLDCDPAGPQP